VSAALARQARPTFSPSRHQTAQKRDPGAAALFHVLAIDGQLLIDAEVVPLPDWPDRLDLFMAEDIERWNPLVRTLGFAIGQMTAAQASPKATGPGRSIGEWITCDSRIPAKSF
jgi:hypothetical protein